MAWWQTIKTWFHGSDKAPKLTQYRFKSAEALTFRFASESDIKQLLAVEREVYAEIPWTASHFRHEIKLNHWACFMVAEKSDLIQGYIGLRWDKKYSDCHISNYIVRASAQNQGIGSKLFEQAVELARLLAIPQMSLEVARDNQKAQGFYRKRGFSSERVLPHYYADGSDAISMRKELA